MILEVDEGKGFERWTEVRDFAGSKREDKHYTLDLATGKIRFGNGEQGKIPALLFPQPVIGQSTSTVREEIANIQATIYRWGGGARGNTGADKITSLEDSLPYVESVTNLRPSEGGKDEETLDQAKLRAPQEIRSRSRAVTAADFEFLATHTEGARIRRAKALPFRHPKFEPMRPAGAGLPSTAIPVPGVVTVIVVPDLIPGIVGGKPLPTEETLTRVAQGLRNHALITTEIYAAAPRYRKVEIQAQVIVSPSASSGAVRETLTKKLLSYFHPLEGGDDGKGWEFGKKIYFAEVFRLILNTEGVIRLEADSVKIFVDDKLEKPCTDIDLDPDELVFSEKHQIEASHG